MVNDIWHLQEGFYWTKVCAVQYESSIYFPTKDLVHNFMVSMKHTCINMHILKKHKCTWICTFTYMQTASPGLLLISESCVHANTHTHIFLTHNFNWSHSLSNCNNQVIHSWLFPAYYSFLRLPSQSCAKAKKVRREFLTLGLQRQRLTEYE